MHWSMKRGAQGMGQYLGWGPYKNKAGRRLSHTKPPAAVKRREVPSGYTQSGTTLFLIFTSTIEPMEHNDAGWLIE